MAVQLGLASRGYDRGRFSVEAEAGVHHFPSLLKTPFAGVPDPAAGDGVVSAPGPPGLRPER